MHRPGDDTTSKLSHVPEMTSPHEGPSHVQEMTSSHEGPSHVQEMTSSHQGPNHVQQMASPHQGPSHNQEITAPNQGYSHIQEIMSTHQGQSQVQEMTAGPSHVQEMTPPYQVPSHIQEMTSIHQGPSHVQMSPHQGPSQVQEMAPAHQGTDLVQEMTSPHHGPSHVQEITSSHQGPNHIQEMTSLHERPSHVQEITSPHQGPSHAQEMTSPHQDSSHIQAQTTDACSAISQEQMIGPNLQQWSCYGPIKPLCHPFFDHLKRHFLKQPQVLQEFTDTLQAYACNLTAIVNELSALGEDRPSWREWLSTHLMPLHMVIQLPDGQVGLQQRVLPESPLASTGTTTADKDSDRPSRPLQHAHGKKRRPRQCRRYQQKQRRRRQRRYQRALLQVILKQASCRPQSRIQFVDVSKRYSLLIIQMTRRVANLLHPVQLHTFESFLPSGAWLEENIYRRRQVVIHLPLGGTISHSWNDELQYLGSLAVDTVYPAAALCRLTDIYAIRNDKRLEQLREGESFWHPYSWSFFAGSRMEGAAMEDKWGHGEADVDEMRLCGADLGVHVLPPGQQPPGNANLVYTPHECPPAYTRLQVLHEDTVLSAIIRQSYWSESMSLYCPKAQRCVISEDGRLWLHSKHTIELIQGTGTDAISGPAGQLEDGFIEHVYSLVCSGPHPGMASYKERPRKHWPSTALLDALLEQPMLLVMVGPKGTHNSHLMFRISWSHLELILMCSLAYWLKQGYVCFKYTVKSVLRSLRPLNSAGDGRSRVGSYHLKTVFLRHLEEHPPQQDGSPFQLMLDLCHDLQHYLLMGCLPHYFLPKCDLLGTVGDEERQYALQAIGQVIADPLAAIVMSPSNPRAIYGQRHSPNDLVRCFKYMSSQPSCPKRREVLQWLIRQLDHHREGLHQEEVDKDSYFGVSGRPGLVRLADYFQREKSKI